MRKDYGKQQKWQPENLGFRISGISLQQEILMLFAWL